MVAHNPGTPGTGETLMPVSGRMGRQGVTLEGSSAAVGGAGVSRAALRGTPLTHKAWGLLLSLVDTGFWMNTMFGGVSKASVLGVSVDAELVRSQPCCSACAAVTAPGRVLGSPVSIWGSAGHQVALGLWGCGVGHGRPPRPFARFGFGGLYV